MDGPLTRDARAAGWTISSSTTSCSASSCRADQEGLLPGLPSRAHHVEEDGPDLLVLRLQGLDDALDPLGPVVEHACSCLPGPQPSPPGARLSSGRSAQRARRGTGPSPVDLRALPGAPAAAGAAGRDRQDHDPAGRRAGRSSSAGTVSASAETRMRSYGASCGQPNRPGVRALDPGPGHAGGGDVGGAPLRQSARARRPRPSRRGRPARPAGRWSSRSRHPRPARGDRAGRRAGRASCGRWRAASRSGGAPIGSARSTAAKRRCDRGRKLAAGHRGHGSGGVRGVGGRRPAPAGHGPAVGLGDRPAHGTATWTRKPLPAVGTRRDPAADAAHPLAMPDRP